MFKRWFERQCIVIQFLVIIGAVVIALCSILGGAGLMFYGLSMLP